MYAIDITNLSEEQRGDVSQSIHELMDTCLDIVKANGRDIGKIAGNRGDLTVGILRDKGYDVSLWLGCGHCLQGLSYNSITSHCECACHAN